MFDNPKRISVNLFIAAVTIGLLSWGTGDSAFLTLGGLLLLGAFVSSFFVKEKTKKPISAPKKSQAKVKISTYKVWLRRGLRIAGIAVILIGIGMVVYSDNNAGFDSLGWLALGGILCVIGVCIALLALLFT